MSRRHALARRAAIAVAALFGLVLLLVGGAILFVARSDLGPYAADFAGASLDRKVSIASLRLGWDDGLSVELGGLAIANAAWSETAEMIVVERASARIDAGSLLGGALRYEHLALNGLRVTLERDENGVGNWEFGGGSGGGGAIVPKHRTDFPTLIDASLEDGLVTYRTSSGAILKIELDEVRIASSGADAPVAVTAAGAYNEVAAQLDATADSFETMRDAARPFGLAFTIETETTTASYDGTLMQPLDFDGADGKLSIDAADSGDLARMFRAGIGVTFPLSVAGQMTRDGNDWRLAGAAGSVAGNPFAGALRLIEAGRGAPDEVVADLDFERFDIGPFTGEGEPGGDGYLATPLALAEPPGINIDADLRAGTFIHGDTTLADVALVGRVAGRRIAVETLAFALAGGRVTASGSAAAGDAGSEVSIDAAVDAIDAAELARRLGAAAGEVTGTLDGRASVAMTGDTLGDGLATARGHAVLAMNQGRISRQILEKASTNILSLFRDRGGSARITCALGVLNLDHGVGRVPLLELRTSEATLNGRGTVNLAERRIDMTFMTAPDSTGFFALDVPFRVHGPLTGPSVEPQFGGGPRPGEFPVAAGSGGELPAAMRRLVEGNPCGG